MIELTSPEHAARLLLLASLRAGTFNEDQARDETGKWTAGGVSGESARDNFKTSKGTNAEVNTQLVKESGVTVKSSDAQTAVINEALAHALTDRSISEVLKGKTVEVKDLGNKYGTMKASLYIDSKTLDKEGPGFVATIIYHEAQHAILTKQGVPSSQQENRVRYKTEVWANLKAGNMALTNPAASRGFEKAARASRHLAFNPDQDRDETGKPKDGLRGLAASSPLHRAADTHEPKLLVAVRYAFAQARRSVKDAIAKAVAAKAAPASLAGAAQKAVAEALEDVLRPSLAAALKAGGEVGATKLRTLRTAKGPRSEPRTTLNFRFDATDERAISWADKHAAELVTGISETTREDISNVIAELLETGDWDEALEELLAAVGDDERAALIARHEAMTAVSEGQREAWDQAVEAGLLPENALRTWITTPDDKLCPICEELDGKTAALGEEYESDIDGPPAHVGCRCTEGIA